LRRHSYRQRWQSDPSPARAGGRRRELRRFLLPALAIIGLALGGWLLLRSPLLQVQEVKVVVAERLDAATLAAASGLEGQNILFADTGKAKERLSQMALIKDLSIERRWPGKMVIKVKERQPWGYWQVKDDVYVIDDEGFVLDNDEPDEGAPTIVQLDSERRWLPGERVEVHAVDLARQLIESAPRSLGRAVVGLEYSDRSGLTVVLEGDLRATFGDDRDLDYKISVLYVLLEKSQREGREVHAVDLRFVDSVSFQ
jgi:cell division septal protein FtsQ